MPNSYRIRTQVGVDKLLQVKLDQDYDTLEVLSMAIFPNDVYTRSCADFGVVCGRVFANKGLGLVNARVSIFIPIDQVDESNPIISTLYPYKSFEDFNEDGYKYNLLPYSQSHSGHVPVGTFPDRLDVLSDPSVIEVYDKYYKFTAKTNDAGDYMIFGIPLGEYDLFMQVDLSDIGEFSLTPQDLLRMGRATEAQVNGTRFKFSENYSELPQIVTLKKVVQVAPFYGENGICQHYITRADFDITSEAQIELSPTAVFIGSMISTKDKKKLKRRCRVPAKQGWLCDMISGPGQIEAIRQTIRTDDLGYPILEQYRLQNDGKIIDENGAWMTELPMNLDYVYTDEYGQRRVSADGSVGVPIRARYRFKIKWQQSPSLREENKRAYFLVPNIKEHGWEDDGSSDPTLDSPVFITYSGDTPAVGGAEPPSSGPFDINLPPLTNVYYNFADSINIQSYVVVVDGVERPDMNDTIPLALLSMATPVSYVAIRYISIDPTLRSSITFQQLDQGAFMSQASYAFSISWADYGTPEMISEAVNCQDRFFEFDYNKVYTVSQLIDRYSNRIFPQKSIQIKHITDNKCEGDYNTFPVNDVYYRYDFLFIAINFILSLMKPIMILVTVFLHVLAFLWPVFAAVLFIVWLIQQAIYQICRLLEKIKLRNKPCKEPRELSEVLRNPFKNVGLPLFLYTEDGCERCRCRVEDQELDENNNQLLFELQQNAAQFDSSNVSRLADIALISSYFPVRNDYGWYAGIQGSYSFPPEVVNDEEYAEALSVCLAGNGANDYRVRKLPFWEGNIDGVNVDLFSTQMNFAEKMNLFNTKAKYFDNMTNTTFEDPGYTDTQSSFSPGNTGWNQVKVTWNPDFNDTNDVYHFDNLIVLLVDSTGFTKGDILTFQDPLKSLDPNVNKAFGQRFEPGSAIVRCSNPNMSDPSNPLLTTIYDMTDVYPNDSGIVGITPDGGLIFELEFADGTSPDDFKQTSCYPMDIEYFQVIKEMSLREFLYHTYTPPPLNTSDKRFSLPWRFLRSGTSGGAKFGPVDGDFAFLNNVNSANFGNGQYVYREFGYDPNTIECLGNCLTNTTNLVGYFDPVRSFTPNPSVTNPIPDDERPDPGTRLIFLQRGVDPNGPNIPMVFDLRRFFGVGPEDGPSGEWENLPLIDNLNNGTGGDPYDLSDACIINGKFKPNQPILPGGDSTSAGFNTNNSCGFICIGVITAYNQQMQPIVNTDSQCLASLTDVVTCNAAVAGTPQSVVPILQESTSGSYIDDNNIFQPNSVFIAPSSLEIRITIFLRFQGQVNDNDGLEVLFRNFDDSADVSVGFFPVTTSVQTITQTFDVSGFVAGESYKLEFKNYTTGEITFFADIPSWTSQNTFGLKLPKHNDVQYNDDVTNRGSIFFESQFFRYNPNTPISPSGFTAFTTTMPTYYSALDEDTVQWGWQPGYSWRPNGGPDLTDGGILSVNASPSFDSLTGLYQTTEGGGPVGIRNAGSVTTGMNAFKTVILPYFPFGGFSNDPDDLIIGHGFRIPCGMSWGSGADMPTVCGNEPADGISTEGSGCNCYNSDNDKECAGCCRYRETMRSRLQVYPDILRAERLNEVANYWGREYVEGGSAMGMRLYPHYDRSQVMLGPGWGSGSGLYYLDCVYSDPGNNPPEWFNGGGDCEFTTIGCEERIRRLEVFHSMYISPCYATFPNRDPEPGFAAFFGGNIEAARRYWYVNPNHEIRVNNRFKNVFRTDRLPSSDTPQTDNNGNGYLLHQNNGFSIYRIENCEVEQLGGGELITPPTTEVNYDDLPGGEDGPLANVVRSLSECQYAVDLNSYYTDAEFNPQIYEQGPYSRQSADLGSDWLWFRRGRGCYNLVSKPLASLFPHVVPGDDDGKFYWDIASIIEWVQRLKLTFAQCFEIFSHTFSNNWINGTLYAYPFQNQTIFDEENRPIRRFCRDTIYFHNPLNNYYYRSSPWNGTDFIGKPRDNNGNGNLRNLQTPTTILDMGPKNEFIQELVYSDDYDGYIVSRIPDTSYQDTTDLLNLFVLSRIVNSNFIQQVIPLPVDEGGNEEGSDDPSVGAMFSNTRWGNGSVFGLGILPGLIDADYSQMISINSEFGVQEYSPDTYTNDDIFFGQDEGIPGRPFLFGFSKGGTTRRTRSNKPVFAVYFSGDNQLRDYISPRRTIWLDHAPTTAIDPGDFTEIDTSTQTVPFYQWNVFHDRGSSPSVFGYQSNNFITEYDSDEYTNSSSFPNGFFSSGYQALDRFSDLSEYFHPDGNDSYYYKGFLLNFSALTDSDGNYILDDNNNIVRVPTFVAPASVTNRYTFGAPFHFYFGLIKGASAIDLFIQKYVDTNVVYE
jgi:hypothetical protein